jgi:hypothetical protein
VQTAWLSWIAAAIAASVAGGGLIVGAGGCFSPRFEACAVSCGAANACPEDQFCLSDGKCHASEEDELCRADPDGGDVDGSTDGGDGPDGGDPPDAAVDASIEGDAGRPVTPTVSGQLVICEIHKNPFFAQDPDGEWFEVFNPTDTLFDLEGLRVRDLGVDVFDIDEPVILRPGARVVFGRLASPAENGGLTPDFVYGDLYSLANADDEIIIQNPDVDGFSVVIDGVNYDAGITFPSSEGFALSLDPDRHTATANNDGFNWCDAPTMYGDGDFGSPGEANPSCP